MNPRSKKIITNAYGSIAHLPDSKMGVGDKRVHEGQARICLEKVRNKHDRIIVTEKLDGSCVAVYRLNDELFPISRAGYHVSSSEHKMHAMFGEFVELNKARFLDVLKNNERICGEWMVQAHGLQYELPHEPFVAFDIMVQDKRIPYDEFVLRAKDFVTAHKIHDGKSLSLEALMKFKTTSNHGSLNGPEGFVYRVENQGKYDFMAKWVRHDHEPGIFLPGINEAMEKETWNTWI